MVREGPPESPGEDAYQPRQGKKGQGRSGLPAPLPSESGASMVREGGPTEPPGGHRPAAGESGGHTPGKEEIPGPLSLPLGSAPWVSPYAFSISPKTNWFKVCAVDDMFQLFDGGQRNQAKTEGQTSTVREDGPTEGGEAPDSEGKEVGRSSGEPSRPLESNREDALWGPYGPSIDPEIVDFKGPCFSLVTGKNREARTPQNRR